MTTLVNSFEGGTSGATITTGNSGGSSGSAFNGTGIGAGATLTYDNTVAAHGSLSAKVVTTATAASSYVLWTTSLGTVTTAWFRQYLYFASLPGGSIGLVTATNSSSALCSQIGLTATGHLFLDDGTGANIHSFSTAVPTGQWFRVEGFVTGDPAAGQISVQLYTVTDGTVPAESFTSTATQNTTSQVSRIAFGAYFTASNVAYWQDDVGASGSGYLGPVVVPSYVPDLLPAPPGFLSPAAFPFPNGPFGLPNEPAVPGLPYLIGNQSSAFTGSSSTVTVTKGGGTGDTVVVVAAGMLNNPAIQSCVDSRGNAYSATQGFNSGGMRCGVFTAANPLPLRLGDTVTVTWAAPVTTDIEVIGLPGACLGSPGGSLVTDQVVNGTLSGNAGINVAMGAGGQTAYPEVALCWVGADPVSTTGPVNWPPDWTVLNVNTPSTISSSVAYKVLPSRQAASAAFSFQGAATYGGVMMSSYKLETRYAPQAALLSGLPQPPGFLAPGSAPDVPPLLPAAVNEAPPVTPVPYLIGVMNDNGTNTSRVIPVTATTNPGDAVAVFCTAGIGVTTPLAATDTQGNSYSLLKQFTGANQAVSVAQNTSRLTAGTDSVTVNWTAGHPQLAIAVGIPAGAVGGSGEEWLTYDLFGQTGAGTVPSITLSTATGAPGAPEVILAFSATTAATNGPAAFGQDFTVIGNTAWQVPTAYTGAVAYKVAPSGMAPGSLVVWTQQNVPNAGAGLMYLTFRLETRVAPNQPLPPMPPGMQSPGAWQYQPFELPNDAPTTTPQPYFIGQFGTNVSGNKAVIPVQNPTNAGDAIIVSSATTAILGAPVSCTDTQGNTYSTAISYSNSNPISTQYISQNSRPLTSTDTITVTYPTTAFQTRDAVAIGVPSASVVASYGNSWLTNVSANTNNSSASNSSVNVFGAAPVNGPMMVIGYASYSTPGNPPTFPQNWQVIRSFTAGSFTITVAASPVISISPGKTVFQAVGVGSANFIAQYVALQLETRIASQPGLMAGLPSAPGFIAPGSGPDTVPFTPGVINDAPPQYALPYVIAQGQSAASFGSITLPVQNPSNPGDVILAFAYCNAGVQPGGVTDTEGNSYSMAAWQPGGIPGGVYVARSPAPLLVADQVTCTFTSSSGYAKTLLVIGVPAAMYAGGWPGAPGAGGPLTYDSFYAAEGTRLTGGSTFFASLSPAAGVASSGRPVLCFAVFANLGPSGPPSFGQDWTPVASSANNAGTNPDIVVVAYKFVRTNAQNTTLVWSTGLGPNTTISLVSLYPELNYAPRSIPDTPPGMLAPGAWQYQPMPRAIGSLAQVITPTVLAGSGSMSAGGTAILPGAAPLNGAGTLLGTGHKTIPGAAALAGTGTATSTGSRGLPGSALLAGSGALGGTGHKTVPGAALLSGTGSGLFDARVVHLGHAALTAPGTVTAVGTRSAVGAAALSGSAVLTCSYLSARIVITGNIMFPDNQSGTYGAAEAETTVIIPGVTDGTYT